MCAGAILARVPGWAKRITAPEGISSVRLGKELSIRQASAWFLLKRLRKALGK
jgi:hypothetical protein